MSSYNDKSSIFCKYKCELLYISLDSHYGRSEKTFLSYYETCENFGLVFYSALAPVGVSVRFIPAGLTYNNIEYEPD